MFQCGLCRFKRGLEGFQGQGPLLNRNGRIWKLFGRRSPKGRTRGGSTIKDQWVSHFMSQICIADFKVTKKEDDDVTVINRYVCIW